MSLESTSAGETVIAQSLDQKIAKYSHPNYKLLRLVPLEGSSPLSNITSSRQLRFELPTEAFNLARSYLAFTLALGEATTAGRYNKIFADTCAPIRGIRLQSRSGQIIADLDYVNQMVRIMNKAETAFSEYISDGLQDCLAPSNTLVSGAGAVGANGGAGRVNFLEPNYIVSGAVRDGAGAGNVTRYYKIPLNIFKNTIFEADKDLLFPEILVMTITFAPKDEVCYQGSDAVNHATNAVACEGQLDISNVNFYLSTEVNPVITNLLRSQVNSGLSIPLPYVYYYFMNRTSTNQTVSLRFNTGHGKSLKRVYHTVLTDGGAVNTKYDSNNTDGVKVSSYYTTVNSKRTTDFDLTCSDATGLTVWLAHRDKVKNSVLLNNEVYMYNWFHMEDFANLGNPEEMKKLDVPKWNLTSGIPLNDEIKWDFIGTTANSSFNHHTFVCVNKTLKLVPNMVIVE